MINIDKNREINERLIKLYKNYGKDYLNAYVKAFNDSNPPSRINEFGIIDITKFNSDNGVLFVAKETNNWYNEEFDQNILFRKWLYGISVDGVCGKGHVQKYPTIWYNTGRWAMLINNPELNPEYIRSCKLEALKAIGTIAFTNMNKVRGKNISKNEYYSLAYSDISGELLRKELEIIKPKIIVCCGTYDEVIYHAPDYQSIAIKMPHPAARMSCTKMLSLLSEQLYR